MNPAIYIAIFLPLLIILLQQRQFKKFYIKKHITSKRKGGKPKMLELAKRFIGKECLIYTFNSTVEGTVTEVSDSAILVQGKSSMEIINLDFIVRIREYPKGKNGKKKSVVLD